MSVIEIAKIQIRRGQENTTGIPQLDPGEFGWAEDTQHLYIGKRITEGANSDANSRILTEIDLGELQSLLGTANTTTLTSVYDYRTGTNYISSAPRFVQSKLDDLVNLRDFSGSAVTLNSGTDITQILQNAINNLYANSMATSQGFIGEPRRRLMIPAGYYIISNTINLPPFAELVGEGQDITTLVSTVQSTSTFRTVDAAGNDYKGSMASDSGASKGVILSNMTLGYQLNLPTAVSLVSLDNTEDALIRNVTFSTVGTSSFITTGTGISIRNNTTFGGSDAATSVSRNAQIVNCQFSSLNAGIQVSGLVSRPVIENNTFRNLVQGVNLSGVGGAPGPINTLITKNKFDFIKADAIHADITSGPVISSENVFYYVGNGGSMTDQSVTTTATSILTFNAPGNLSSNDYFNRQAVSTSTGGFYYNPLVSGFARVNNASTRSTILPANTTNTNVLLVPLTGYDQMGIIEYQLDNTDMSRKGRLTLNISSDGYASVSDYYNYSEISPGTNTLLVFSTNITKGIGLNYIIVTCSSFSGYQTKLEFNLDLVV